jgi:cytochrome c peroxidase
MSKRLLLLTLILLLSVGLGVYTSQALTTMEELGKAIFFDQNLSFNKNQSCATCHAPSAGWTGPDAPINSGGAVYQGSVTGRFGNRKPPSSAYATQSPILYVNKKGPFMGGNFWDGRATGEKLGNPAADQAQGPFLNPLEQALPSATALVAKVCASGYSTLFKTVWGIDICSDVNLAYDKIALSIAAYEASPEVNAFSSKYDYSLKGKAKLNKEERRGFALFQGKGKCARCHVSAGRTPLFTNFTYDNLGIPKNPENPFYTQVAYNPDGAKWIDPGLGGFLTSRSAYSSYAHANHGKHKVPTLRNVDLRPDPGFVKTYGHNGYFKSLKCIVNFYNTRDVKPVCPGPYTEAEAFAAGCWPPPEVAQNMNMAELGNLGLTAEEEAAIVAFLKALSDGYEPRPLDNG